MQQDAAEEVVIGACDAYDEAGKRLDQMLKAVQEKLEIEKNAKP